MSFNLSVCEFIKCIYRRCVCESILRFRLHILSKSPFSEPFKNGFNADLRHCLHVTLKRAKVPLTKIVTLIVRVNEPQLLNGRDRITYLRIMVNSAQIRDLQRQFALVLVRKSRQKEMLDASSSPNHSKRPDDPKQSAQVTILLIRSIDSQTTHNHQRAVDLVTLPKIYTEINSLFEVR